jgi:class 3 adenylate cyclase
MWLLCGRGPRGGDRVPRRIQTLLFTDIVGSTDHLRELGDAAWAALLARHHGMIRAVLAAHGGREVDTAGDGFLARFDTPSSAVRAAVAAVAALGMEIRAGLHTGEVELDREMTGVGVHLAARVMAQAGPGQVLVSSTVRDLMAGSGLGFVDLGVRELKGFPERWRLFAWTRRRCGVRRHWSPRAGPTGRSARRCSSLPRWPASTSHGFWPSWGSPVAGRGEAAAVAHRLGLDKL